MERIKRGCWDVDQTIMLRREYVWPGWVGVACTVLGLVFVPMLWLSEEFFPLVLVFVFAGMFLGIGQILKSPKKWPSYLFLIVGAAPIVFFIAVIAPNLDFG